MKSELRVHGVSGTQPRDMLYTDPVLRDPLEPDERRYTDIHRLPPTDAEFDTQAFHWGGLTAGSRLTAFWILLSPFVLANAAGWMSNDRKNRFGHGMIRAAGLGLTALFVTEAFTAIVLLPYLWFEGKDSFDVLQWTIEFGPGLRRGLLLALIILISGLFLLLVLKASTQSHFEPLDTTKQAELLAWPKIDAMAAATPNDGIPLDRPEVAFEDPADAVITDPRLWRPDSMLHRLRRLHLAVGYMVIALEVAAWTDTVWATIAVAILLALLALMTILTSFIPTSRVLLTATAVAPSVGAIVLLASMALIFTSVTAEWQDGWIGASPHVVTFLTGLVMGVFVFLSMTTGLIVVGSLVLATFFGAVLGLAVGIVVESVLGLDPPNTTSGVLESNGAAWVAVAMLFFLWWLAVVAVYLSWREVDHTAEKGTLALVRRVVLQAPKLFEAAAFYGLGTAVVIVLGSLAEQVWAPTLLVIDKPSSWIYELAVGMGVFLVVFFALRVWKHYGWKPAPLVLLGAGLIVFAASRDFFVVEFFKVQIALKDNLVDIAVAIAIIVPGAFMLRSILTGIGSGEAGQKKRRSVGILWDIGSFWPRWYHPLAPPAYGPVAVTKLWREVRDHPARAVLGAHSQGSLIAAVALTFTPEAKRPARFVTYGSQLGNLYPAMFPGAGIGGENGLVARVRAAYGTNWVNLYRETDPIGGHYVELLGAQNRLVNTWTGHSRYEPTPEYKSARLADGHEDANPADTPTISRATPS